MPESPVNTNHTGYAATPMPVKERREIRRVDVSFRLRIRPADYSSQDFEDVQVTLNASKKAFYFFTMIDCYQAGMRVKVTRLYGGDGGAEWEEPGQVVRVHRRQGGYGVVVQLETRSHLARSDAQKSFSRKGQQFPERRRAGRQQFTAAAEVTDMRTATCLRGRISDLSLHGCYVDTLNPFPVASAVRLQIFQDGQVLDALASVSSHHPGWGMGLAFGDLADEQRLMLENWLTGPPAAVEPGPRMSQHGAANPTRVKRYESYSARLVQLLVRKGVLSQSEAMEVLGASSQT